MERRGVGGGGGGGREEGTELNRYGPHARRGMTGRRGGWRARGGVVVVGVSKKVNMVLKVHTHHKAY